MKIFFLNGPPRSGKDTAGYLLADMLRERGYQVTVRKFSQILKEGTHALFEMPRAPHDAFEDLKDKPLVEFMGATPRQAYIAVSERLMKPLFGEDVFGRMLARNLRRDMVGVEGDALIITDSGFVPEALALLSEFPKAEAVVIRMHRKGCDFGSDSRGYITLGAHPQVTGSYDLPNNSTIENLRDLMQAVMGDLLEPWSDQESDPLGDMRRVRDAQERPEHNSRAEQLREVQRELDFGTPRDGSSIPPEDSPLLGA